MIWLLFPALLLFLLLFRQENSKKILVVLGSGGHTTEMLKMLPTLQHPLVFVMASSDNHSKAKLDEYSNHAELHRIPRSRHVHQSWLSTPFTTAYSFLICISLVYKINPKLIVCNGPGTCVPIGLVAWFFTAIKIMKCKILFIESFARVKKLSLSGKILYYFSDRFIVHWPELKAMYPRAEHIGKLL
jgi:beta-1,4-N-acetylglucosaminyltransferase